MNTPTSRTRPGQGAVLLRTLLYSALPVLCAVGVRYGRAQDGGDTALSEEAREQAATGRYGFHASSKSAPTAAITNRATMSARYIRIENRGHVEFSELEAYDANNANVALKKPVRVSNLAWGNGARGNDGVHSKDNHIIMRSPTGDWWEVDLGEQTPLTHVIIHERPAQYCEGFRPLDGATFSLLDGERRTVASCEMEAPVTSDTIVIPMHEGFFHQRDITARFGVQPDIPGNIFAAEEGTLRFVVPEPETLASGRMTLSDLEGRTVWTADLARGTAEYAVPLPSRGYYTVTGAGTYDNGLVVDKTVSAAVVGKPIDRETRLKSIFGILGKGHAFVTLGAAWSWTGMYTHHTAKTESGYEWSPTYAYQVEGGRLNVSPDVNNFILLNWLPGFLQSVPASELGNHCTSPPNDYEEFVRFIKWVVSFIPDFVHYLGPVAEPSWSFKGSPEELAKYHEVVATTVREVRPDIRVIGPMMSPGNRTSLESIRKLDELGMFDHLDGISINPYPVDWPDPLRSLMPEADFIDFIDAVIHHFASTGRPDYPVYVTEFGWYVGTGEKHVDELTRARYSSRAALLLATRPSLKMVNFFSLGGGGGFSYLNLDGTPRPTYAVMAHTFRWLADCSSGVSIKLTPTTYLAAFKKGERAGMAIWDIEGESAIQVPAGSIRRIQDFMGRDIVCKGGTITAGPSPLFIDLADDAIWSRLSATGTVPDVQVIAGAPVSASRTRRMSSIHD